MTQQSHCWAYTLRKPDLKEMFITALFTIARTWKQPRCPLAEECIRKLWHIHTMEYYSAIKKNTFESLLMKWMFSSVTQSCPTLRLHESQHTRPPCPSPTPGIHSNSRPSSRWCHPAISSCCPLLLPPSIFASIRVFSNKSLLRIRWPKYWSFSISPSDEYSGLISFRMDWISLQSKGLSGVFSNIAVQKHQFFSNQLSL